MRRSHVFAFWAVGLAAFACGADTIAPADGPAGAAGSLASGSGGVPSGGGGGIAGAGGSAAGQGGGPAGSNPGAAGAAGQPPAPECVKAADCDALGDRCLGTPLCSAGHCLFASPPVIDDGNACTKDACDGATGNVFHDPVPVGDGDPCTVDLCDPQKGVTHQTKPSCQGCEKAADCDDGQACTTDTCLDKKCTNTSLAAGAVCLAGNACREDKVCDAAGQCVGGGARSVDDANKCTVESCNELGMVVSANKPVDDGNPCTVDGCDPKTGVSTNILQIDDGNACTIDSCTMQGPKHSPLGVADGDPCTDDACDPASGKVTHLRRAGCKGCTDDSGCLDEERCTVDTCNASTGECVHAPKPEGAACDNATFCDGAEICKAGSCSVVIPRALDDGLACTKDGCDELAREITHRAIDVDDHDECTEDACDPATGSVSHLPRSLGGCCAEDAHCATASTDSPGLCYAPPRCDVVSHRCVARPTQPLEDGDLCTVDACTADGQALHTPKPVDDANACTVDSCDSATGQVHHAPKPVDDGNACTEDVCDATSGIVLHSPTLVDDGNECTDDSCSPNTGVSHTPRTTGGCCASDAQCVHEVTTDGRCLPDRTCNPKSFSCDLPLGGGELVDDGNPCTKDSCGATGAVSRTYAPGKGCCMDDAACPPGGPDEGQRCRPPSVCQLASFTCSAPKSSPLPPPLSVCAEYRCGAQGAVQCCLDGPACATVCSKQGPPCDE